MLDASPTTPILISSSQLFWPSLFPSSTNYSLSLSCFSYSFPKLDYELQQGPHLLVHFVTNTSSNALHLVGAHLMFIE